MKIRALILFLVLLEASTGWSGLLLDLTSSGNKVYSVELTQVEGNYNVVVKEETSRGKFELIYESQNLTKTQGHGFSEYADERVHLTHRQNGTAHLKLDNGVQIDVELQN